EFVELGGGDVAGGVLGDNHGVEDADDFPVDEVGQFGSDFVSHVPIGEREDEILDGSSRHGLVSLAGFCLPIGTVPIAVPAAPKAAAHLPFHRAASANKKRCGLSSHRQALYLVRTVPGRVSGGVVADERERQRRRIARAMAARTTVTSVRS